MNDRENPRAAERLSEFVLAHLNDFQEDWGLDSIPSVPKLDLFAQDYLRFAERELEELGKSAGGDASRLRVNCLGHLKRAIDSQIEVFSHAYGLHRLWRKRGLKVERKLEFLAAAGIISTRSLSRMNMLRNAVEHKLKNPDSLDMDCLFDVAAAFVAVLQAAIILGANGMYEWSIGDPDDGLGSLCLTYGEEGPRIVAVLRFSGKTEELEVSAEAHEEFAFFFRVIFLLNQLDAFYSRRHIGELLQWSPTRTE